METEGIDLRSCFHILLKKMWIIMLITVLLVASSGVASYFIIEPEYETYTTLMLSKPNTNINSNDMIIQYDDVLLNQKLVTTYGEIAKSRLVSNEVIKNMKLDLTPKELSKKLHVSLVNDTEIIKITAIDGNPEVATELSNETAKAFMKYVKDIMKIENVQVIDEAQVPLEPIRPAPILNMAIAGALGIMLSVFLIFLLEYLDNTIKTPKDAERYLELPILGMIPRSSKYEKELISKYSPKSPTAEAFRTLRTNIQFLNIDKDIKIIVVTSAGPSEGKSTVISNLAVTMAQADKKILLIDADLRKPQIHTLFNLSNVNGLTTILVKDLDYSDIVVSTGMGKLDVLTSGFVPPNPVELLDSKRMKDFLEKIKDDYDMILLDSPPVGLVTDAAVLSTIADGAILVCASKQTVIDIAKNAKALLEKINANILGAVINKVPINEGKYYKYNYYQS